MGIGAERNSESASKTEIGELEIAIAVNQQILRLEIAMKNAVAVTVADALAELAHEFLDDGITESEAVELSAGTLGQGLASAAVADGQSFHVFLQIEVEKLENEVQLVTVGVNNVEKAHNIGVAHLLEKRDLANSGRRDTLILSLEADLLERHYATIVGEVAGFVDDSIGA